MRAFLAIVPNEEVHAKLVQVIQHLKIHYPHELRFIKPEKIHFTLHFFPELKLKFIPAIADIIKKCFQPNLQFNLKITNKLLLPTNHPATVLAYQLDIPFELTELILNMKKMLLDLGYPDHYPEFLPHITIARSNKSELLQAIQLPELNTVFKLEQIILYESVVGKGEFVYREIEFYSLIK